MTVKSDLSRLPLRDKKEKCWQAIIETPKGSHHKFDYEPELQCFSLSKTLPEGMTFPYDFGFFPSTLGDDGDPLDVLVLLDFPAVPGALVEVRVVGAIKAEQRQKSGKWVRNDRLMAVAISSRTMADIESINDLRSGMVEEIIAFFEQYNELEGKQFRSLGNCAVKGAATLLSEGQKRFRKKGR